MSQGGMAGVQAWTAQWYGPVLQLPAACRTSDRVYDFPSPASRSVAPVPVIYPVSGWLRPRRSVSNASSVLVPTAR